MTNLLLQPSPSRGDTFPRSLIDSCRTSIVPRYGRSEDSVVNTEMKHSKSDDLVLQSSVGALVTPECHHARCDSPIPKTGSVVYEDDLVSTQYVLPKAKYFSDSEADSDTRPSILDKPFSSDSHRTSARHVGLYDQVDPEDSIRDMITENDFYRFVLFKRHYDKYLHLSHKYEEARNIAYYLEEKYHEIKAERDGLSAARHELERKLEFRDLELHEKEEELFLQLEKVVRLEEDCEKLRAEKEKFGQWKDKLEREKNEAYRQLKRQSSESEATRRGLERARQEVVRQVTVIAAERDSLEKENEHLKETLSEERRGVGHYLVDLTKQKKRISQNMVGLEKEVTELKYINCQSTSLNNQFKKGMKHLATCRRKKCSVCTYTKDTFGEYRNDKKLLSCFQAPLQDLRKWIRPMPNPSDKYSTSCPDNEEGGERLSSASGCSVYLAHSSPFPSTRSEYSFRHNYSSDTQTSTSSPSPSPSFPLNSLIPIPFISYIDDESTSSESSSDSGHGEDLDGPPCHCPYGAPSVPTDTSLTSSSSAPVASSSRAFSSDSGFSSELYESGRKSRGGAKTPLDGEDERSHAGLQRSKWTSSFRRLINKVSKR